MINLSSNMIEFRGTSAFLESKLHSNQHVPGTDNQYSPLLAQTSPATAKPERSAGAVMINWGLAALAQGAIWGLAIAMIVAPVATFGLGFLLSLLPLVVSIAIGVSITFGLLAALFALIIFWSTRDLDPDPYASWF